MKEIDQIAKIDAIRKNVMPECLHLPIAAKTKDAITGYIGDIITDLSDYNSQKAFLVSVPPPLSINTKLPIWKIKESDILHKTLQVWVDVDYKSYRKAYIKAFPEEDISVQILDHILNRRIARLKGFKYLRIVPISRNANSSSGALSEKWGVDGNSTDYMRKVNRERQVFIQYADLADLVKMLNIKTGGGVMDIVNDAQRLLVEP